MVKDVASLQNVTPRWVQNNATLLGGIRLGNLPEVAALVLLALAGTYGVATYTAATKCGRARRQGYERP